ncbi:putative ribonuclease H-like domain-containing protein [Tanacetum coccineum]
MVPKAVLMRSGLVSLTTARSVNNAQPKTTVNSARPMTNVFNKAHSTIRRPINNKTATKNSNFNQKVNTIKDKNVNAVRPKAVVNAARPKAVLNAVKGNQVNVVKASACWVWKPKTKVLDHVSNSTEKGVINSGWSRHMTGNMSYLTDFEEIDGGYVAFRSNPKGGKITGRGIKREFSIARTPQQNGVTKRKNRTLIEAAKTMLVDSKLPTTFWAEAINTACYVQNKILVTKPHNKTPYELFLGRKPTLGFMRPFGCPVIILNTIDHLGKFDGKADEGFLIGYSINGYTQEEGIDYDEAFAPVARIEAIRLFLAYVSFKDFVVYQMDVKSAFLYGKIEEEVYVCQPPRFEDLDFPNRNGFQRGKIDKTLFIRRDKGDILLVQVYVDDIIFGSTKKSLCTEFEKMMHKKFQMSSMGELTFFLGLQVKQKEDGIFISQDKYVTEILKKFGFTDVKTASTPMETQKPLLKDEDGEEVDVHLYRSMIGSLMYLTSSRPDIMFAVCACARYQVNPKVSHLHAVKRIFRYLKGQPKLGLWYPKDSPFDLVAYTDSDYAGASLDRKSTTGGCQFLGCRLISWQCKKQTVVANSTTEAEYVAASSCCGQVLWIQNQLLDYGDSNEKKLIQMIKIHTDKNVADLLTKAFDLIRMELELMLVTKVNVARHKLNTAGLNLLLLLKVNAARHNLQQPVNVNAVDVLDLENIKTAQAQEIISLKLRVKKLEKKRGSRTHKLKRLYKVGRSARMVSSDEARITLDSTHFDADTDMFGVHDLDGDEVVVKREVVAMKKDDEVNIVKEVVSVAKETVNISSITKDQITLAQALAELKSVKPKVTTTTTATTKGILLQEPSESITTTTTIPSKVKVKAQEQEEFTDEEKAKLFVQLLKARKKHFAAKRAEEKRNGPPTRAQQRSIMCTYLKNMARWKPKDLKNKSFANIQELFDKAMKRVNTFVDMDTKLVEGSEVRAEGSETREEIVPDEEEVAIDAIPLATKPPSIMLKSFDKVDLETLWKLVKANHGYTRLKEGYERVLWGDLKVMFEPHVEDAV